jgi:acyl carrier protein
LKEDLIRIFKKVLEKDEVNVKDNIFDLGGNSLLIYKLSEEIKKELNLNIKPIDIMMYPNIEMLYDYLNNNNNSKKEEEGLTRRRKRNLSGRRKM